MADRPKVPVDEEDEEEKAGMPQKKSEYLDDHTLFVRVPTLLEIVRGIIAPTKGKGDVSVVLSPLTTPSDKKNQKKSKATETNEQKVRLAVSLLDERDGWDVRNAAIQLGVERGDATVVGYYPILRRYAAAVPIDASDTWNIFVFGGVEDVMMDGDLFSIDLSVPAAPKYKLLTQSIDNIPSHRANHRTIAGLGKMWLFDGVTNGDVLLNDLFLLSKRILFLLRAQRTFVYLRGSRKRRQDETVIRDLWMYSLVTRCWTKRDGSFARKLNWEAAANSSSVPHMKLDFVSNANSFPLHSKCVSILSKILDFKKKSKSNP
ncbi:hypothetical protein BLNAU_17797 [Blattamonas nauphoetae]|uniref:Uncharacterized protein n=1 Tax=Blattamonas nauphoetae TaxID=2049346 RepID=A0ABQ9XAK6_9EUKA|nr:hypothetical protein BLNAU_17797 [Blattamonas nauphoetae]